jgi:adenosylmethionine-8-amino-7-oxononanoate aminotransferase
MKDYADWTPITIASARGSLIKTNKGFEIIDSISSWWCKSLGHAHPRLQQAALEQMNKFEHVIFANTTYETIDKLSQKLCNLMPQLNKAMFAGDGSSAVEIALKMCIHAQKLKGLHHKTKIATLSNGYHGETSGALSVSDVGIYREPYEPILFEPIRIKPCYVNSIQDPKWHNAKEHWGIIESEIIAKANSIAAIIIEPIIQGAGGMRLISKDFLNRLAKFTHTHGIYLIADEIMTGVGRTGEMLACEHACIKPDIVCLSKGLTSGWLPFSAVLTTQELYQLFYDDYDKGKSFLHSHTYSGNALGASIALETLEIIEDEQLCQRANKLQQIMLQQMHMIAASTGLIHNIRGIGAIVAADIVPTAMSKRIGYRVYQEAVRLGAWLRPLGNTIYWMPPLNCPLNLIERLKHITEQALLNTLHVK